MNLIHIAFIGSLLATTISDDDPICGGITILLGILSVLVLRSQLTSYRRRQAVWQTNSMPAAHERQFVGASEAIPFNSTGIVVRHEVVNRTPKWVTDPQLKEEMHKQDVLAAVASYYAQAGGVTNEMVLRDIEDIEAMQHEEQYEAFGVLYTKVINGHESGRMNPAILKVVTIAWDRSMGYEVRDVD